MDSYNVTLTVVDAETTVFFYDTNHLHIIRPIDSTMEPSTILTLTRGSITAISSLHEPLNFPEIITETKGLKYHRYKAKELDV